MRYALLFLVLLLSAGCATVEDRAVLHYIKQIGAYEQTLSEYKATMAQVQLKPVAERAATYQGVAMMVRTREAELAKLQVPAPAQAMQTALLGLYDVLARYLDRASKAGGSDDPELKKLAQEWQDKMKAADDELSRLSARYR